MKIRDIHISLKYKIAIFISLLIFILFFLTNYIILKRERNMLYENLIVKGNSQINNFALYCENAFLTGDELNIEDYVTVLIKAKEVKHVYIVLKNLTYFLNNDQTLLGRRYSSPEKTGENPKENYNIVKREREVLFQFYKPIYQINREGKRVFLGMGYIELTTNIIKIQLNQIKLRLSFIVIFLLTAGVIGAFMLSYLITDPLKKLVKGISIIAKGNLKYKIRIHSKDEIEGLALEFNRMTTQLATYQKRLIKQKMVEQELQIAKNIQSEIIPEHLKEIKNFDLFSFHRTSRAIGGDYHNIFPINKNENLLIIADVSGKGVPASLLMSMFHTIIITLKKDYHRPILLMKEINNIMSLFLKKGNFITVLIAHLNSKTGRIKMISAGHEYPALIDMKKKQFTFLTFGGIPVGLFNRAEFESKLKINEHLLLKESMLIFYTDGLRNIQKMPMNNKNLASFFKSLIKTSGSSHKFRKALLEKTEMKRYNDDITIVGIRRT